ncbi:MAG: magnesium and cobalt transport protein CorA [Cryomorphaceae bacterium]|nr:MAG: magnesium and cobalt transport protein CorA [Cryomorphaceae bacterium]
MARKKHQKTATHRRAVKTGLPPGTAVFTGRRYMEHIRLSDFQYNSDDCLERENIHLQDVLETDRSPHNISWLNIEGLHEVETIETMGAQWGMHKLTVEDVLNTSQRPKLEEFDNYLYVVLRMLHWDEENKRLEDEQVSFVLLQGRLITFQERTGDVFDHVRKRLREGKGLLRGRGADYLLYALIDSVIDYYFLVLEKLGMRMEEIEDLVLEQPESGVLAELHRIRRDMLHLRRSVYPLRDVMNRFERAEEPHVQESTRVYIRDLYDHTIQVIETVEVFRDMASGMLDLYMNSLSNRLNTVMKTLTVIATIFIPLTFIVGIYGMNFEHMPELAWEWGYFGILAIMTLLALGMLLYFRVKKWF